MANRVGTYLSDDSIRKRCAENFAPPGSKTYELFLTPNAPIGYKAQRPQNPLQMMRTLSRIKGIPLDELRAKYANAFGIIKPQEVVVIPPAKLDLPFLSESNARASAVPTASRPDVRPVFRTPSSEYGLPSGTLNSRQAAVFQRLSAEDQKTTFKSIFHLAETEGVDFQGEVGISWSAVDNIPGGKLAREMLFRRMESVIYRQLGANDAQRITGLYLPTGSAGAGSSTAPPPLSALPAEEPAAVDVPPPESTASGVMGLVPGQRPTPEFAPHQYTHEEMAQLGGYVFDATKFGG